MCENQKLINVAMYIILKKHTIQEVLLVLFISVIEINLIEFVGNFSNLIYGFIDLINCRISI